MQRPLSSPAGFTLLEILVALVIIGLLVGALVPSTLSQVSRGEHNRLSEDLASLTSAAKMFRLDVQRWPGDMEDLYAAPLATAADNELTGGQYPAAVLGRWAGPYVEEGTVKGDTLATALGGFVVNRFSQTLWGAKPFLTIKVKNIPQADAQAVSLRVDLDSDVSSTDAGGQVRWIAGDTLVFLAAPVQ
ncbi:MAG: prepilin-type N-terminal cleavage/methylation domain-containing protein [Gemmatimonadetes bacterium]|nr:prepilin-type N-terminal cleavage/methylation domain-containing protein [Gemmatimonadota bacterium]